MIIIIRYDGLMVWYADSDHNQELNPHGNRTSKERKETLLVDIRKQNFRAGANQSSLVRRAGTYIIKNKTEQNELEDPASEQLR
ncbi:unnamed protein product [Allacma fusca]|uniref:Uncharacterized protein n=1 Tax=Allacma fusca TaxID=39272 RepID=A0A8J2JW73_9HEXA|nr:unnamed protein product [Allacma fusca]